MRDRRSGVSTDLMLEYVGVVSLAHLFSCQEVSGRLLKIT
jgi:hypothetical protein